jgi:hypothetical protein
MQKLTVQIGELQRKLEASTTNFEKESKVSENILWFSVMISLLEMAG